MIIESIKKQREKMFTECRRLLLEINSDIQEKSQESVYMDNAPMQSLEDNNWIYNICDCCQRSDVQDEEMTRIDSGHQLCPACLSDFYAATQNTSNLS